MSIFAIGDIHLSLSGEKPMDIYGGEWVDYLKKLEENWRRLIGETDTVLLAGDHSWALKQDAAEEDLRWIAALPGKKVLIKGNHDLWWHSVSRLNQLDPSMLFLQNAYYDAEGIAICGARGWICPGDNVFGEHDEKIYARELMRLAFSLEAAAGAGLEERIVMLHFPPTNEKKDDSGFLELIRKYKVSKVVYGHLHGRENFGRGLQGIHDGTEYCLVSLDFLACRPLRIAGG
ncbi:MAG: metallophosphoesterase [Clostridiales Family XIII bacterium]|jgi:predicted phosphohydrolase|nr:metallophosphoesterase [Clostridiales Family XIII bacterium]